MFGQREWAYFRNCLAMPFAGALHQSNGKPLYASCHRRRSIQHPKWFGMPDSIPTSIVVSEEIPPSIYIPFLEFRHFGHLLTETAGWLSSLLQPSLPKNIPTHIILGSFASTYKKEVSQVLGWPENNILGTEELTGVVRIRKIWVPIPSMVNRDRIYLRHFDAVQRLIDRVYEVDTKYILTQSPSKAFYGRRIYLSRSRLSQHQRTIEGESDLENELLSLGWQIVHPQELTIREQLLHLVAADVIAGPLGSAFHLLMALGLRWRPKQLITLGLKDELNQPGPGQNYAMHFRLQGFNYHHLPVLEPEHADVCYNYKENSPLHFTERTHAVALLINQHKRD